jgi:iron complex outermembrane receptor protein
VEETTTYNAGLDFGFAKNRIYGSVDVYQRKTKDLLNYIPVPAGSNLTNYITTNVGDLENKGFEVSLGAKIISTKDLVWQIDYNLSYNENKITRLTKTDDPTYLGVFVGGIAGGVGNTSRFIPLDIRPIRSLCTNRSMIRTVNLSKGFM